jgi:hypothetical protein
MRALTISLASFEKWYHKSFGSIRSPSFSEPRYFSLSLFGSGSLLLLPLQNFCIGGKSFPTQSIQVQLTRFQLKPNVQYKFGYGLLVISHWSF